ncbi:MAG: indole-3-glycerol phosphate synthase TrpC, partial [Gemmatimonadales bacterium]
MTLDYLAGVLARKWAEIEALRPQAVELRAAAADAVPTRGWTESLRLEGRVALIAEVKRRAPSAGTLRADLDPAALAATYEAAGAAAISVLTDRDFDGALADLQRARAAVSLPALRKDFVLDAVQLFQSRATGADAVLLIVRALSDGQLVDLLGLAGELGLGVLVEVHDLEELRRALEAGAAVIGINNRDLRTLATRLDVTGRMVDSVPRDRVLVSESGIEAPEQVRKLGERGVDAVLVGRA